MLIERPSLLGVGKGVLRAEVYHLKRSRNHDVWDTLLHRAAEPFLSYWIYTSGNLVDHLRRRYIQDSREVALADHLLHDLAA